MPEEEWVRAFDAIAILDPVLDKYSARLRICARAHGGLIRARAEQFHYGSRVIHDYEIPKVFWWAEGNEALDQDWLAGDFSTWVNNKVHYKAFGVTIARSDIDKLLPPPDRAGVIAAHINDEDTRIINKINEYVPSAALSYTQAILDLGDGGRVSFRGPALELREALREILDHLAPDDVVITMPGYEQELNRTGPTMRQKVRFIMRSKGKRTSSEAPEQAVSGFEEAIAGLARAVYERSSKATHVAGERQVVVGLRHYVVAILHDILEM